MMKYMLYDYIIYVYYLQNNVCMCFLFVKQLPSSFFMTGIYSYVLPFLLEK